MPTSTSDNQPGARSTQLIHLACLLSIVLWCGVLLVPGGIEPTKFSLGFQVITTAAMVDASALLFFFVVIRPLVFRGVARGTAKSDAALSRGYRTYVLLLDGVLIFGAVLGLVLRGVNAPLAVCLCFEGVALVAGVLTFPTEGRWIEFVTRMRTTD